MRGADSRGLGGKKWFQGLSRGNWRIVEVQSQLRRLVRIVQDDQELLPSRLTDEGIETPIPGKVPVAPAAQGWMLAAKPQQRLNVGENLLLVRGAALGGEGVARVIRKPPGEIAPVVGIVSALHPQFVARVELWNAAHGQQQRKRQFQLLFRCSRLADEALHIVVAEESNQLLRPRVEPIALEHFGQLSSWRPAEDHVAQREEEGEVEYSGDPGINSVELRAAAGKESSDGGIRVEYFADGGKLRVSRKQRAVPIRPEGPRDVGIGIQPVAVEPGLLGPPEGVLQQVLRHAGIFLIQVRKQSREPAFHQIAPEQGNRVHVGEVIYGRPCRQVLLRGAVKPVLLRHRFRPRVPWARMVQHLVEENLDAVGMSGSDQFLKFIEAAEVFVYSVVVHRAVAMIVLRRSVVVVVDGVQP